MKKIKLTDTDEARERWKWVKKASAEVDTWPCDLLIEVGTTTPGTKERWERKCGNYFGQKKN